MLHDSVCHPCFKCTSPCLLYLFTRVSATSGNSVMLYCPCVYILFRSFGYMYFFVLFYCPRNDIYEPNPGPRTDLSFSWLGLMATTTTTPSIPRVTVDFSALRFHLGCLEYPSCPLLYASSAASQRYLRCTISNCRVFKHKVRT